MDKLIFFNVKTQPVFIIFFDIITFTHCYTKVVNLCFIVYLYFIQIFSSIYLYLYTYLFMYILLLLVIFILHICLNENVTIHLCCY